MFYVIELDVLRFLTDYAVLRFFRARSVLHVTAVYLQCST